jgi:hypothetical protein
LLNYYDKVLGPNDLELGSFEDIGPLVVASISTLSVPSNYGFESIATPRILDLEMEAAWELMKDSIDPTTEGMGSSHEVLFPLAFFHNQ